MNAPKGSGTSYELCCKQRLPYYFSEWKYSAYVTACLEHNGALKSRTEAPAAMQIHVLHRAYVHMSQKLIQDVYVSHSLDMTAFLKEKCKDPSPRTVEHMYPFLKLDYFLLVETVNKYLFYVPILQQGKAKTETAGQFHIGNVTAERYLKLDF